MKRLTMVLLMSLLAAPVTFGATGTWTGTISDTSCGLSHRATGGQVLNDTECAKLCLQHGARLDLVTDDFTYFIGNPQFKGVRSNIGNMVQIDGDLKATTITVTKVTVQKASKSK